MQVEYWLHFDKLLSNSFDPMKKLLATIRNNIFLITLFPLLHFSSIIDPQTMGHPQGQGPLRHTRVAEAPDTGTVTGEATITGPQIIQQSLISLVDQPVPVIQMFKEIIEIKGIKEGNIFILTFLGFVLFLTSLAYRVFQGVSGKNSLNNWQIQPNFSFFFIFSIFYLYLWLDLQVT